MKPVFVILLTFFFLSSCKKEEKESSDTQFIFVAVSTYGPDTVECYWYDNVNGPQPSDSSILYNPKGGTLTDRFAYTFEKNENENWEVGLKCKMKGAVLMNRFFVKTYINSILYRQDTIWITDPYKGDYSYWSFKKP